MNKHRRKVLKYLLISIFIFPLLKIFGIGWLTDTSHRKQVSGKKLSQFSGKEFTIVESEDMLQFYNSDNEKVFSVDRKGSLRIG